MRLNLAISNALAGKLVVVCGPGGVGKTTISAALAAAASQRRKTLVCTIDPSKRLRTSLGLAHLTGAPQCVKGRLYAMRLDPKGTFDDLVRRHASSSSARDRILQNPFYQQISRHLAGTHEVMAMEALMGVAGDFDLIVLDTPPSTSALASLDAPKRVREFLDGRILRYFLKPYFVAGRLALQPKTLVGKTLLRLLDSAIGLQFLRDLSEFFLAFEGLFDSFRDTATQMEALLRAEGTSFILVTATSNSRVSEGSRFARSLEERSLKAAAIVANRVHPWAMEPPGVAGAEAPGESHLSPQVYRELRELARRERKRAAKDARHLRQMASKSGLPLVVVPELRSDVHDLKSLAVVSNWLCPQPSAS